MFFKTHILLVTLLLHSILPMQQRKGMLLNLQVINK